MGIAEVFGQALNIANEVGYLVRFYESDDILYTEKRMSYMQLGLYLVSNKDRIKRVDIRIKEEKK